MNLYGFLLKFFLIILVGDNNDGHRQTLGEQQSHNFVTEHALYFYYLFHSKKIKIKLIILLTIIHISHFHSLVKHFCILCKIFDKLCTNTTFIRHQCCQKILEKLDAR